MTCSADTSANKSKSGLFDGGGFDIQALACLLVRAV